MRHTIMDTTWQIVLALVVGIGVTHCEPPLNTQYGVPGNYGGYNNNGNSGGITNSYGTPLGNGHDPQQDYVDSQPKSYEFGYSVQDDATGNDFGRKESSDGETVRGEYRVHLPDVETQIVTYTADWKTGFHADVRYEGVATYPDQYNVNNNGYNTNSGGSGYDYPNNNIGSGYNRGNNGNNNNNYQNNGGYNNQGSSYNYQIGPNTVDSSYNYGGNSGNSLNSGSQPPTYGPPAYR